jgi:membrane-associated phospholipid phosphatase
MGKILRENKVFLYPFLIVWLLLAVILFVFHKATIHMAINQFHTSYFDFLFKNITHLGDGLTPTFLALIFLFFSFRKAIILGGSSLVAGLLAQFFKRAVFPDMLRPKAYLKDVELYLVPGVEVHDFFSFPSGHASTAFSMFMVLALFSRKKPVKLFCFLGALLTGFSRIYLSQHFLVDVYFGAILGIVVAFFVYYFVYNAKGDWLDKSLTSLRTQNE